jgi:long-subunit acyl-CoA synthetase (AMP-forming)
MVQGQIPKVLDDIVALQPTMFCGVPRVFDRIHAGIYEQVRPTPQSEALTACCLLLPAAISR